MLFSLICYHAISREIEFKLNSDCEQRPEYIDQGVRLEIRLQSANLNSRSTWFPIRYYTPSLVVPSEYESLVEFDSSMTSVRAQGDLYNTSFPLMVVSSGIAQFLTIREYLCGQIVQNLTEDMELEWRWVQRYGKAADMVTEATWFLDDINIRIWNGTSFLQVLSEDFNNDQLILNELYTVQLAEITMLRCGLGTPPHDYYIEFRGCMHSGNVTRRSINILNHLSEIFVFSEGSNECKLWVLGYCCYISRGYRK